MESIPVNLSERGQLISEQEKGPRDRKPDTALQNKIIIALRNDIPPQVQGDNVDVLQHERQAFLNELRNGEYDTLALQKMLNDIPASFENSDDEESVEVLFKQIENNKQMRGFVAWGAKGDYFDRDTLTPHDLSFFLYIYPEPSLFQENIRTLIEKLGKTNRPEKIQELEHSLTEFMACVYGERYAYYEQLRILMDHAQEKSTAPDTDPEEVEPVEEVDVESNNQKGDETFEDDRGVIGKEREEGEEVSGPEKRDEQEEREGVVVTEIDFKETSDVLKATKINGEAYQGNTLTTETLIRERLHPKYKITLDDTTLYVSTPYDIGRGRIAVVAYVQEAGKGVVARSWYRSNSQAVWRYLPNYTVDRKGSINWFGKGYDEQSATLPAEVQKVLAEVSEQTTVLQTSGDADFVFAGTARTIYAGRDITYVQRVNSTPQHLEGTLSDSDTKVPPEQIHLSEEKKPDFSKPSMTWTQDSSLYGSVTFEAFPSIDGELQYIFCRDQRGRAWVGGVETVGEVNTTGLRSEWVHAGDLVTPLYEYVQQSSGYGSGEIQNNYYISMYENYISKIPVIQEYLQKRSHFEK